jgi:hypothetical protein
MVVGIATRNTLRPTPAKPSAVPCDGKPVATEFMDQPEHYFGRTFSLAK